MDIQTGYFYFIKDDYYDKVKASDLMRNKEGGLKRPCFYCFKDLKVKKHMKINPDILNSEEYQNMSYEAQLDIAKKLYKNGDISAKEMQEIENELIDAMAFRDALSNEF